jgi:hypothetical protein
VNGIDVIHDRARRHERRPAREEVPMSTDERHAPLLDDLRAQLASEPLPPEEFKRLKAGLRALLAGQGPARWYRNPHGSRRWHVTDQPVIPGMCLWAVCGSPVYLEGEGWSEPPTGAVACQRCQRSRLAHGLIAAERLRRRVRRSEKETP